MLSITVPFGMPFARLGKHETDVAKVWILIGDVCLLIWIVCPLIRTVCPLINAVCPL